MTGKGTSAQNMIEGLTVTQLAQLGDDRGTVLHMLRSDAPEFTQFGECYFSEILPGAVKAWKRHRAQTQNLAVPVGQVRMVIFDDREGSPTRGQVEAVELGRPEAYVRLRIPPGLWYGFQCVGDTPALIVNCADLPHDPTESEVRSLDDPEMPHLWGIQAP